MRYVYFVSYNHRLGHGNLDVSLPEPITTIEHIRAIERKIGAPYVVVLNFILLRTEED